MTVGTTINPIALSKYVINRVFEMRSTINSLKLQKLLYYIEAWHLVYFEEELFDEEYEAWVHGPVIRKVFDYFKDDYRLYDDISPQKINVDIQEKLTEEQMELVNDVLDEYGKKSGYHLECLTHDEEPWIEARRGYGPSDRCEEIISKETMRKFYSNMAYGK